MNRRTFVKTAGLTVSSISFGWITKSFSGLMTRVTGERMPLMMPDNFEEMNLVSWRVEEGVPDPNNPLLEPEMPWDAGGIMSHGTVLRDPIDGVWKAWHISTPAEETVGDDLRAKHEHQRRVTYLESLDGVQWKRPELSLVPWPGYEKTNILFDVDQHGSWTYVCVLVDPNNREWPYEMFLMRNGKKAGTGEVLGLPAPITYKRANYRLRSKDGIIWQPIEGPLHIAPNDICYIYKQPDGRYVAYYKDYIEHPQGIRRIPYDNTRNLRVLGMRTSQDGTHWDERRIIMQADWRDPNHLQFMELCPVLVKGGFIGMVTVYDAIAQIIYLQMAASRDGENWWVVTRRPALPNAPLGEYGGGMIWQTKNPIVMGNKMHIYYSGTEGIHGEIFDTRVKERLHARGETTAGRNTPTLPFAGALCRATWTFDRLYALTPSAGGPMIGIALTIPQECSGKQLWVNMFSRPRGSLRAELITQSGKGIPGFSKEDCNPVRGDHHRALLVWKGGDRAPVNKARIKFYLTRSFLYGYEWIL